MVKKLLGACPYLDITELHKGKGLEGVLLARC